MSLKNLFSPFLNTFSRSGLNSNNPKKRIKAILEELEPGSPKLEQIIINDADSEVKTCALQRINSLDAIQNIIMKSRDEKIKNIIYQHFSKLLSGEIFPVPELQQREEILKGHLPNRCIEYIALNAKESELRIIALGKLNRDPLLGDIALNDPNTQVKITAAEQIGKKSTLERVCKKSRSKDKRVYKICKEKLQTIIEDEQRPIRISHEIVELCDQLEKIFKRNLLIQEESTINKLRKKWSEYLHFSNTETQLRYHNIINKIDLALEERKQNQKAELKVKKNLQQIIHNLSIEVEELLSAKENGNSGLEGSKLKIIEDYKTNWQDQVREITAKQHQDIIKQYNSILILIEQTEENNENISSIDLLNQYIAQAEHLLTVTTVTTGTHYISKKFVDSLATNFAEEYQKIIQSKSSSSAIAQDNKTLFNNKINLLQQQLNKQQEQYNLLIDSSNSLIKEINNCLEDGQTDKAIQLKKKYHQLIDNSKVISSKNKEDMLEKVRSCDNKLNKLSSWKSWANNRERENLCLQAEQVLDKIKSSKQEIAQVYNSYGDQVKVLRSDWKKLKGRSPDELWAQFNNSCNQCFEIFEPYFDQQSELRSHNLQLKQAICKQLEDYISFMNWPTPASNNISTSNNISENQSKITDKQSKVTDWIQVNKILRQAKTEWQKVGVLDKKDHQKINKKFNSLVETINKELKHTWADNHALFQKLIDQVFALHKYVDNDLDKAIIGAKDLQFQWKKIGPVQHFQRKNLWKNFRKGCDIIFKQRDAIKLEENQANESVLMEKTGLCENLEALNQQDLVISDLNEALVQIETTWNKINEQFPTRRNAIEKRFEQAKKNFDDKIKQIKNKQLQQQQELLEDKASICTELENSAPGIDDKLILERWQNVEKLSNISLDKHIESRFKQALLIADKSIDTQTLEKLIDSSHKNKEQLCLSLEILTGKDSPDEQAQSRMEFQIQQMNSNLSDNKTAQSSDEIIQQWYLLANFKEHNTLNSRFKNIL